MAASYNTAWYRDVSHYVSHYSIKLWCVLNVESVLVTQWPVK